MSHFGNKSVTFGKLLGLGVNTRRFPEFVMPREKKAYHGIVFERRMPLLTPIMNIKSSKLAEALNLPGSLQSGHCSDMSTISTGVVPA